MKLTALASEAAGSLRTRVTPLVELRYFVDDVFIGEIEIEARYCLASAKAVDHSLNIGDVDGTYRSLHSLLAHAAMISKFLWPVVKAPAAKVRRMQARAHRLRDALQLSPAATASLNKRDLRNSLEHFDERLDDWAASGSAVLVDRNVAPVSALDMSAAQRKLRHYDPTDHTYTFGSSAFSIGDIVDAVKEVATHVGPARVRISATA